MNIDMGDPEVASLTPCDRRLNRVHNRTTGVHQKRIAAAYSRVAEVRRAAGQVEVAEAPRPRARHNISEHVAVVRHVYVQHLLRSHRI